MSFADLLQKKLGLHKTEEVTLKIIKTFIYIDSRTNPR
jgi:hypothetical protein